MNELVKQCLWETMPVVDVYRIKSFTANDIPISNKYPFKTIETIE